ncbi:hypothetical protein NIES2101_24855 [Calothrix sp. HK-06]|nr:hypothetical protein NIES2101_24855 [Calothrix sp. HK-06]
MKLTIQSIALTTLLAVSSGIAFFGAADQVFAKIAQADQGKISKVISARPSIVGNWKGLIIPQGDDTSTSIEIDVLPQAGSTKQGTWKFWGYDSQNNKNIVFQSGTLIATVDNNNVILELKDKGKTMMKFQSKLKNSKQLSGESFDGKSQIKYSINLDKGQ